MNTLEKSLNRITEEKIILSDKAKNIIRDF